MTKLNKIEKEIALKQAELQKLKKVKTFEMGKKMLVCESNNHGKGCNKKTQVKKLVWIRTYWYVPPTGCTGGDYWNEGEGNYICPKCEHINRTYNRTKLANSLRKYFHSETKLEEDYYGRNNWTEIFKKALSINNVKKK